jgi:hypothetical protein
VADEEPAEEPGGDDGIEGRSLEDRAREAEESGGVATDTDDQMRIPGTVPKLTLTVGGLRPEASELRLGGGSVAVDGQFMSDDVIRLIVIARVDDVHFPPKRDSTGRTISRKRRHIASIQSITVEGAEGAE